MLINSKPEVNAMGIISRVLWNLHVKHLHICKITKKSIGPNQVSGLEVLSNLLRNVPNLEELHLGLGNKAYIGLSPSQAGRDLIPAFQGFQLLSFTSLEITSELREYSSAFVEHLYQFLPNLESETS
jgi:hypothetical protein